MISWAFCSPWKQCIITVFPTDKKERSKGWAKREGESGREKAQQQTRKGKLAAPLCHLTVLFKPDAPFGYFMS